jgi:hypothetical protein
MLEDGAGIVPEGRDESSPGIHSWGNGAKTRPSR